jgi:hypothetical protein
MSEKADHLLENPMLSKMKFGTLLTVIGNPDFSAISKL